MRDWLRPPLDKGGLQGGFGMRDVLNLAIAPLLPSVRFLKGYVLNAMEIPDRVLVDATFGFSPYGR